MRFTIKIFAIILGLGSMVFGSSSCEKEDNLKCCTWTYDGEKYKYCIGDSYDGYKITEANWEDFKSYVKEYYGAKCD